MFWWHGNAYLCPCSTRIIARHGRWQQGARRCTKVQRCSNAGNASEVGVVERVRKRSSLHQLWCFACSSPPAEVRRAWRPVRGRERGSEFGCSARLVSSRLVSRPPKASQGHALNIRCCSGSKLLSLTATHAADVSAARCHCCHCCHCCH
jgi:hypothetical protein